MENKSATKKSVMSKKRKYTKWKEQILKLYAGLERIAREEEYGDGNISTVKKDFEKFFCSKDEDTKPKFHLLLEDDILEGTVTDKHRNTSLLHKQKDSLVNGDTLLLRALSINVEKESDREKVLSEIIKNILVPLCPELIVIGKGHAGCKGITPVHLAILKEDIELLRKMKSVLGQIDEKNKGSKNIDDKRISDEKQSICAIGPVFQGTVMMAGTPLGVAALKFNKDIFNLVLECFASGLDVTNAKDDNIVHSLIKFAYVQPDKLSDVIEMLSYVINCKFPSDSNYFMDNKWKLRKKARKLLMMKNKENLNPMQLAVKRQQFNIFEIIMNSEVYRTMESGDGLFNEEAYDVTEIETLTLTEEKSDGEEDEEDIKPEHHESILEYLVHQQIDNAFLFADFLPVKEVIRSKWVSYRWWFNGWFVIHVILMVLLSVAAVYRSELEGPVSRNSSANFVYVVTQNTFVTAVSIIGLVFGLLYLAMEVSRRLIFRFQFKTSSNSVTRVLRHFSTPYSNLIFRIYFILFSLLLIVDCVVSATEASGSFSGYENYCLIFAVIIGWYLVLFFLQTLKAFSMFTVLIQRAVLDMLKFALVMTFFLVAFSVAMYMIMQGADTEEEDFYFFSTTMVKMLTIMLGIGDLGILFQARQPYLAILVFVLFVLLTTILLLNALIAMMSNSCTDLMNNNGGVLAAKLHCRLQKLSVILFLEGFFPRYICKEVGDKKRKYRYHNNEWVNNKQRRIWIRSSVNVQHKENEIEKAPNFPHLTNPSLLMQHLHPKVKAINSPSSENDPAPHDTTKNEYQNNELENPPLPKSVDISNYDKITCPVCKCDNVQLTQRDTMTGEFEHTHYVVHQVSQE